MADTWDQVPLVVGDRARLDYYIAHASQERCVRVSHLGDSTVAAPGGSGVGLNAVLTAALFRRTGHFPETPWYGPGSDGGGTPPALFPIVRQRLNGTADPITAAQRFGGQPTRSFADSEYAMFVMDRRGRQAIRLAGLYGGHYFNPADEWVADVYVASKSGGPTTMAWQNRPHTPTAPFFTPSAGATVFASGTLSFPGADSATYQILKDTTGVLGFNSLERVQLRLNGSSGGNALIGVRFRNLTRPTGITVTAFGEGGYGWLNWINNHNDAELYAQAVDTDIYIFQLGTNDIFGGASLANFKSRTQAYIATIKGWTDAARAAAGKPPAVFVLCSQWVRYHDGTTDIKNNYAQVPGIYAEVADEDADGRVVALNLRRATEERGWSEETESLTGLDNKGLWTDATAYVVDDYVDGIIGVAGHGIQGFRCIQNHTSQISPTDTRPGTNGGNPGQMWVPHRRHTPVSDSIHPSIYGYQVYGEAMLSLLLNVSMPTGQGMFSDWPIRTLTA